MKRRDLILVLTFAVLALLLYGIGSWKTKEKGTAFIVTIDGQEVFRSELKKMGEYPFQQDDGSYNLVIVEEGKVWMKEANCRDGLCVKQGKTDAPSKSIVCLPHKLVVSVISNSEFDEEELDVIVQ